MSRPSALTTSSLVLWLASALLSPALGATPKQTDRLTAETFKGLELRGIGPALTSGRIADIAIHPENPSTWYVAVGSGGVWKTENVGTTWEPIFDDQASYSIGCVAIDPINPEVVWVGTGENVSGRHVGYGDGVYKSLDGGKSWTNLGLATSEHISKILIDPRDPDVVYVAAEGPLWSSGGERGVFKTTDGGRSWSQVLEISENTGVTDLEFDPGNPDVLYAAAYQRRRHIWSLLAGGEESGIYKSTDAGASWRELNAGLPEGDMGKIGLAVSPVDPDVVYATIEASEEERGFYRSLNRGESWEKRSDYISDGTGPHYYQEIYASPHKVDRVYQMDVWLHITEDGGKTFAKLGERSKHVDNHALAFDPDAPDYLLAGSDGGLYESFDHGENWRFVANLPVTQFYKMAVDNATPFYNVVGGTQDNGTLTGPSRTLNVHGIRNQDWTEPLGADGYACQVDPEDPDILYLEWQRGNLVRVDRRTGEQLHIQPQPAPGDEPERWNWDAPLLISPHASTRLYSGSQRLWRSDDRGDSWRPVSGDLTRARNRYELEIAGRVWSVDDLYDNTAMSWYGTLTAISESPLVEGLIYVGSDDGVIQVTEDGGQSWRKIDRLPGIAELAFVNELKASLHDPETVFAVLDNHKVGDFEPYLLKSTDRGRTWRSIAGDLPERHILWSVVEDHIQKDLLFVGTEFGIFFTRDGGKHWIELAGGGPTIAFRDLEIQRRESDLVASSFGRGFWILDDYSPLRQVSAEALEQEALLFPVKKTWWSVPSTPLGTRAKAEQGEAYFAAPNPPFGAVFTYYLKEELKTGKELRREQDKKLREQGEDVPFPGWETLHEEKLEHEPGVVLTVTDLDGNVVRRIAGPAEAGFHRVSWDLRYPPSEPVEIEPPKDRPPWDEPPEGPMAVPGRYRVALAALEGSELRPLGEPREFEVVPLENSTLPNQEAEAVLAFQKETGDLQRRVMGARDELERTEQRLKFLEKALFDTPQADPALLERIRRMERDLFELRLRLIGDPVRRRLREPSVPSILDRVERIVFGHWDSRYGPTRTHRESFGIAAREFDEVGGRLRELIETDLRELEEALEAAGAPWTPGRKIP
ncbi:MAG: glycosyl hydrolase [Thermoanaerobaculia bacterium]